MSGLSTFHSVLTNAQLPQGNTGTVGDVWWVSSTGLLWFVVGDGSLVQLLESVPIPVQGPVGPTGPAGPAGADFIVNSVAYLGTWSPSPTEYQAGAITSYNGFLYMSKSVLNVSDNTQAPAGNPFWQVLGAVNTQRTTAVVIFIDGNGALPPNGVRGVFSVPFDNCTLTGWSLVSDAPGDAVLDVLWSSYSGYPGSLTSIVKGNNPSLSGAQKNEVLDVSALWSPVTFSQGDQLQIILDSASGVTQLTLTLNLSAQN